MLRDITVGNNDTDGLLDGQFKAGPGWDACTGWGVPDGGKLLAALQGGPTELAYSVSPAGGRSACLRDLQIPGRVRPTRPVASWRHQNRRENLPLFDRLVGLESYSGNPAFRRPSINSFAFDSPPRAIYADIVKAGSISSTRAAASCASASRPRWAKADARQW